MPESESMIYLLPEIYQMRKTIRSSREDLERLSWRLFKNQIYNIYENVPFYQKVFQKLKITPDDFKTLNDLQLLPIITKKDIRDNKENFSNRKINKNKCFYSFSSGSTGEPFKSYFDKRCWIRKRYLSKLRARFSCGMHQGERVAIFEAETAENLKRRNQKQPLRDLFLKVRYFSIFDNFESLKKNLIEFKPQNAYGPQSFFFQFARQVKKHNQAFPFSKKIFTSSEYGQKNVTLFISNVLQSEIFDIYGSTEFKEVAWECEEHQGYHINEDEVLCEILNGDKPAHSGEIGDIVLTDLRNLAMPLIRYRIHDRGRMLDAPCRCGRTFSLMLPVAGRASEYIVLPDGEKISPFLFTTSIENFKGLLQYQLIQESETDVSVNLIIDKNRGNGICRSIEKTMKQITRGQMRILIRKTDRILPEENGKFKVVKNMTSSKPSNLQLSEQENDSQIRE